MVSEVTRQACSLILGLQLVDPNAGAAQPVPPAESTREQTPPPTADQEPQPPPPVPAAPVEAPASEDAGAAARAEYLNQFFTEQGPASSDVTAKAEADEPSSECDDVPVWGVRTGCRTPRPGMVSGGYGALDMGVISLDSAVEQRAKVAPGFATQLRFGIELWDQLVTGFSFGMYWLEDERPFEEEVLECDVLGGMPYGCDEPEIEESGIVGAFFTAEAGYQTRFRPSREASLTLGAMLGYLHTFGDLERSVPCMGCRSEALGINASGTYVAPFVRITFVGDGLLGLIARSQWFLHGDVQHLTVLGLEAGLP